MRTKRTIIHFGIAASVGLSLSALILGVLAGHRIYLSSDTVGIQDLFASTFLVQSVTVSHLKETFNAAPRTGVRVKVLIVPGHEPQHGGAEYRTLRERDMVLELANDLARYLRNDLHYEIVVARDNKGWNPDLQKYFALHGDDIALFATAQKTSMRRMIDDGTFVRVSDGIKHGSAQSDVARRLFGINKWAGENEVVITIHIHLNDYPRAHPSTPGIYSGFTIYVPDKQYANAAATRAVAQNIFSRLTSFLPVSNLPKENAGIVEDQDLIAIGESNSADGVSLLIEYGYIYEPQFSNQRTRTALFDTMAQQTALGLHDFFEAPTFLGMR